MPTLGRLSAGHHPRESKPSYCSRDWGGSRGPHVVWVHSKADGQQCFRLSVRVQHDVRVYLPSSQEDDQWGDSGDGTKRDTWEGEHERSTWCTPVRCHNDPHHFTLIMITHLCPLSGWDSEARAQRPSVGKDFYVFLPASISCNTLRVENTDKNRSNCVIPSCYRTYAYPILSLPLEIWFY